MVGEPVQRRAGASGHRHRPPVSGSNPPSLSWGVDEAAPLPAPAERSAAQGAAATVRLPVCNCTAGPILANYVNRMLRDR
jgi:hypothetical protein